MRWLGWSGIGVVSALASLLLTAGQAEASGAIAVGTSSDDDSVSASAVGKATENVAREAAPEACRAAKTGFDKARMACTVVSWPSPSVAQTRPWSRNIEGRRCPKVLAYTRRNFNRGIA